MQQREVQLSKNLFSLELGDPTKNDFSETENMIFSRDFQDIES